MSQRLSWSVRLTRISLSTCLLFAGATVAAREQTAPGACGPAAICGDVDDSGSVSAADALRELRVAVGVALPMNCPCTAGICETSGVCGDVDASGKLSATDALRTLRAAVGQSVTLHCSCSDGTDLASSLLYGSEFFSGDLPPLGDVAYTSRNHGPLVAFDAYVGWVRLRVSDEATGDTVEDAITGAGGSVIAKAPRLGWYLVSVGSGNEDEFLLDLYENLWVIEGAAVSPVSRGGENTALDWNSGPEEPSACLRYHGSLVSNIASRRGGAFAFEPVADLANSQKLSDLFVRKIESVPEGSHQVLTMSLAHDLKKGETIAGKVTPGCPLECTKRKIGFQQYWFLWWFFDAMETQWLEDPETADRTVLTMIAGNTGVALDSQLAALKQSFPNAFKRIVIVGGTDADGSVTPGRFNYLDDNSSGNMLYALGEDVDATSTESGPQTCTGTSYAGPEVASVLAAAWAREPGLRAAQILGGLRKALAHLGTSVLPQGPDGHTTDEFIDLVVAFAAGNPPTTTTTTTTSTTTTTTTTTTTLAGDCWCCCFWIPEFPFGWDCGEAQGPMDGGLCNYSAPGSGECGNGYCESQSS